MVARSESGESAARAARERQAQLTKPQGSLGRLESLVVQLASLQRNAIPSSRPAAALVFAADHPVARHGVSAYPREVTRAMVENFKRGGAAASVLSDHLRVPLTLIDVGVEGRDQTQLSGAGDLRTQDAMSSQLFESAVHAGRAAVESLADDTQLVAIGEIGIGNTTAAAAVLGALLGRPAHEVVGRGTGVDDVGLERKIDIVDEALRRVGPVSASEAMRRLGGRDLAAALGAIERACERGMAVVIDGVSITAAALVAARGRPERRAHLIFGHRSRERAHGFALQALDANPLLDLDLALGEGSGALLALPIIDAACALHRSMATFAEASVPNRDPSS